MKNRRPSVLLTVIALTGAIGTNTFAQQLQVKPIGDSEAAKLLTEARQASQAHEYAQAARAYEAAMKAGAGGRVVPYNAACCYALAGQADDAFRCLERAVGAGWRDVEHLKSDSDLDSLHADARWSGIVKITQEAADKFTKSLKEPELRKELLKRVREDQRVRTDEKTTVEEWKRVDAENTAYMKSVIEKYGWPGFEAVGEDGAQAVFLMIQHADADPEFQNRCLVLLKKAVEKKDAPAGHMAYLTDRVLVAAGKPQLYGSQFFTENGELKPRPIEDEVNVDKRRAEVGLPPLDEYAAQMRGGGKK